MTVDQVIHILETLMQTNFDLINDHLIEKSSKDCCRAKIEAYEQAIHLLEKVNK